jgi:hypothetical protein
LLVPKTNSLTCGNLNTPWAVSYQLSAISFIESLQPLAPPAGALWRGKNRRGRSGRPYPRLASC